MQVLARAERPIIRRRRRRRDRRQQRDARRGLSVRIRDRDVLRAARGPDGRDAEPDLGRRVESYGANGDRSAHGARDVIGVAGSARVGPWIEELRARCGRSRDRDLRRRRAARDERGGGRGRRRGRRGKELRHLNAPHADEVGGRALRVLPEGPDRHVVVRIDLGAGVIAPAVAAGGGLVVAAEPDLRNRRGPDRAERIGPQTARHGDTRERRGARVAASQRHVALSGLGDRVDPVADRGGGGGVEDRSGLDQRR